MHTTSHTHLFLIFISELPFSQYTDLHIFFLTVYRIQPISLYLDPSPNTTSPVAGTTLAPNTSTSTSNPPNSPASHDAAAAHPEISGPELHVLMSQAWFRGIQPFGPTEIAHSTSMPTSPDVAPPNANAVASSSRHPGHVGTGVEGKEDRGNGETKLRVAVLIAMPSESRSKARMGTRKWNVDNIPSRDSKGKGKARASDLDPHMNVVDGPHHDAQMAPGTASDEVDSTTDSGFVDHADSVDEHTPSLQSPDSSLTQPDKTYLDDPAYANRPNPGPSLDLSNESGALTGLPSVEREGTNPGDEAADGENEGEGPYLGADGSYELGIASLPLDSTLAELFVRDVEPDPMGDHPAAPGTLSSTATPMPFHNRRTSIVAPSSLTSSMSPLRRPQPAHTHTRPPSVMRGQAVQPRVHTRPQPRAPPPMIREDISMWPMNFYGDIPAPRPSRAAGTGAGTGAASSSQPLSGSGVASSSGGGGSGQSGGRRLFGRRLGRSKKGNGSSEAGASGGPPVGGVGVELSAMSMSTPVTSASGARANNVGDSAASRVSPSSTQTPGRGASVSRDAVVNGVRRSEFLSSL